MAQSAPVDLEKWENVGVCTFNVAYTRLLQA
jgi:hypothetical protein